MGAEACLVVDTSICGLDALHRACYAFGDRSHVTLERLDPEHISVTFGQLPDLPFPADVVAQFERALIDHRVRADLHRETATIRDLIFRQAFVEADL